MQVFKWLLRKHEDYNDRHVRDLVIQESVYILWKFNAVSFMILLLIGLVNISICLHIVVSVALGTFAILMIIRLLRLDSQLLFGIVLVVFPTLIVHVIDYGLWIENIKT